VVEGSVAVVVVEGTRVETGLFAVVAVTVERVVRRVDVGVELEVDDLGDEVVGSGAVVVGSPTWATPRWLAGAEAAGPTHATRARAASGARTMGRGRRAVPVTLAGLPGRSLAHPLRRVHQ